MYFLPAILDMMWYTRYIWIVIAVIGFIGWLLGAFKNDGSEKIQTGYIGYTSQGYPICCDILEIDGQSVPIYQVCDDRGVPKYRSDAHGHPI